LKPACAALLAAALLSACSVGPLYKRPEMQAPAAYKETVVNGQAWKTAQPSDQLPRGPWWERFQDPLLNELMPQVEVSNQSLKSTMASYYQAAALVQSARSAYFPTITANGSSTRDRSGTAGITTPPTTTNSASLSVSAWELDFWGRIRNVVDSDALAAQASVADIENAKLSLQAQLATSYLALRFADEQINLLRRTVDDYQKTLELTRNRYTAGIAAKSDVTEAETQLKSSQASALDATIARAQYEHAIAVLIGKAPADFSITPAPIVARMPQIPAATPSALLERRPDIAAAERRVASANASVGAAQAALFPTLSLSASTGFRRTNGWDNLFTVPNRFWSIGPSLAFTVFDFGAKRAQIAQAEALYDQDVATYRQTVLTAFQDVEDNLVTLRVLEEEEGVQADAVRAANESLDHVIAQYKAGTVSYLNVITAQTTAYSNRNTLLTLQNRRFAAAVALVKAVGGGFDQNDMQAPAIPASRGIEVHPTRAFSPDK
jgi:NodT family efflux transporter outer membrane factor (OMF) lipoprotein